MLWRCYQRLQQEEENRITEIEMGKNPDLGLIKIAKISVSGGLSLTKKFLSSFTENLLPDVFLITQFDS